MNTWIRGFEHFEHVQSNIIVYWTLYSSEKWVFNPETIKSEFFKTKFHLMDYVNKVLWVFFSYAYKPTRHANSVVFEKWYIYTWKMEFLLQRIIFTKHDSAYVLAYNRNAWKCNCYFCLPKRVEKQKPRALFHTDLGNCRFNVCFSKCYI